MLRSGHGDIRFDRVVKATEAELEPDRGEAETWKASNDIENVVGPPTITSHVDGELFQMRARAPDLLHRPRVQCVPYTVRDNAEASRHGNGLESRWYSEDELSDYIIRIRWIGSHELAE
ncbi:hypothetical protein LQW54_001863 [Pestalotiopsis sp. IQ-011]